LLSSAQNGRDGKGLNLEEIGHCYEVQVQCIPKSLNLMWIAFCGNIHLVSPSKLA